MNIIYALFFGLTASASLMGAYSSSSSYNPGSVSGNPGAAPSDVNTPIYNQSNTNTQHSNPDYKASDSVKYPDPNAEMNKNPHF